MNLDEMGLTIEEQRRVAQKLKAMEATTPKQCEHVKASGEFCGSPALHGRKHCFFHLTHLGRQLRAERARARASQLGQPERAVLELPALEDADSIQIALMQVIDAILNERLDSKRGGLVLYGLQTASSNLRHGAGFRAAEGAMVAGRYEDFEADYELGGEVPELRVVEEPVEKTRAPERTAGPSAPAEAVGRDDTDGKGTRLASSEEEKKTHSRPTDGLEWGTRSDTDIVAPERTAGPSAPAEAVGRDDTDGKGTRSDTDIVAPERTAGPSAPAEAVGRDDTDVDDTDRKGTQSASSEAEEKTHSRPNDGLEWGTRPRSQDTCARPHDGLEQAARAAVRAMERCYDFPNGAGTDESVDDADEKEIGMPRFCDPSNYFLCTILGPMAHWQSLGTERRVTAREVSSQRVGKREWTAPAQEEAA